MTLVPLYLIIIAVPFAVAGQTLLSSIAGVWMIVQIARSDKSVCFDRFKQHCRIPFLASILYVLWMYCATILNSDNPAGAGAFRFMGGYLFWIMLPGLVLLAYPRLSSQDLQKLFKVLALICFLWGLAAMSQTLWGWRVVGAEVVSAGKRAYGFYSHPLTLAYVALLIFPLSVSALLRHVRRSSAWGLFLGEVAIIYASQSRTVQVIAAFLMLVNIGYFLRGRTRLVLVGLLVLVAAATAITDNPVSRKFRATLAGTHDVQSDYPDDRLAFWHAHFEMVKERPIVGHGLSLNQKFREPYYERIGLVGFEKQYEAHNLFLQIAANGGLIALAIFLIWLGWHFVQVRRMYVRQPIAAVILGQTLVVFVLAGLTQNAFQDSEVRFALTIVSAVIVYLSLRLRDSSIHQT